MITTTDPRSVDAEVFAAVVSAENASCPLCAAALSPQRQECPSCREPLKVSLRLADVGLGPFLTGLVVLSGLAGFLGIVFGWGIIATIFSNMHSGSQMLRILLWLGPAAALNGVLGFFWWRWRSRLWRSSRSSQWWKAAGVSALGVCACVVALVAVWR